MRRKIWMRLFLQISIIFIVFAGGLAIANSSLLLQYYITREKNMLVDAAKEIEALDLTNQTASTETLNRIESGNNFQIEIYSEAGELLYMTMWNSMREMPNGFDLKLNGLIRQRMQVLSSEQRKDGSVFQDALDSMGNEYIIYAKYLSNNIVVELRTQKSLIEKSAEISNRFMLTVSLIFLVAALLWALIYARHFAKPIVQMNTITKKMTQLDFNQKLNPHTQDEIGELGASINNLSDTLSATLQDLAEKNAKLQHEIEQERKLDIMRREFVANVSHELKTPISIIKGYAEGLMLNINTDASKRENYANVIIEESDRMNTLVLDLLELSQYESGHIALQKMAFDLSELTGRLLEKMDATTPAKNFALENRLPEPMTVWADPGKTEQILKNYLSNAMSHVNTGGQIVLSCEEQADGRLRMRVYNTGAQIAPEDQAKIWHSFYRADKAHNRQQGRYGLGLSIVRAIQEQSGLPFGQDNWENGVCFWFDLERIPQ